MQLYRKHIKRLFDFLGALLLLAAMLPVFAVVWIAVKISMGSPVLISQRRVGLHGRIFNLYKFRTMSFDKSPDGALLPDERRITKLGAFLRKTSLDEIAQFVNVLKGDMSFIGPRPFMDYEIVNCNPDEIKKRNEVLPGISGLAQISGRNNIALDKKMKKDLQYVDRLSFALDAKICFLTILKVIFCVNSTPVNKNTVESFTKRGGR